MQKNAVVITIISIVAVFGFLFLVYSFSNKPQGEQTQVVAEAAKLKANDHMKWSPAKKVLLIEYGDLQCPACRTYQPLLKQFETGIDAEVSKKVTFVFRHFPLDQIHRNARPAGHAAEAAGKQGKFFEMVDMLYDEQDSWKDLGNPTDYFAGLAKKLKLDVEKFKADISSSEVEKRVNEDFVSGNTALVTSTPTFFLNGKKVEVETFYEFKKLLKDVSK